MFSQEDKYVISKECAAYLYKAIVGDSGRFNQAFRLAKKYNVPIKPTQQVQPYEYGEPATKKTCFWLKCFPKLIPTNVVKPETVQYQTKDGRTVTFSKDYISLDVHLLNE